MSGSPGLPIFPGLDLCMPTTNESPIITLINIICEELGHSHRLLDALENRLEHVLYDPPPPTAQADEEKKYHCVVMCRLQGLLRVVKEANYRIGILTERVEV